VRGPAAAAACALASTLTACATPPPRAADGVWLAPYAASAACVDLAVGERLDYRYHASEPVDFEIRYREAGAVVAPIVRAASRDDIGILEARIANRYCLNWQAGPAGAVLDYRFDTRDGVP
jgi:hypothetical protein